RPATAADSRRARWSRARGSGCGRSPVAPSRAARRSATSCCPSTQGQPLLRQDLRLLGGELLLGQYAGRLELAELLQLLQRVGRGARRRRRGGGLLVGGLLVGRLLVLLRLLIRPAVGLPARHAVRH